MARNPLPMFPMHFPRTAEAAPVSCGALFNPVLEAVPAELFSLALLASTPLVQVPSKLSVANSPVNMAVNTTKPIKQVEPLLYTSDSQPQTEKALPTSFRPHSTSVIIGRKKDCYTSVGNLRLREVVLLHLPSYAKCTKKKEKTEIVTRIVESVRESCPTGVGAFIKSDGKGGWSEVSEVIARDRVASIFRDFLHDQYKSSSRAKVARRREKRVRRILGYDTDSEGSSVSSHEGSN